MRLRADLLLFIVAIIWGTAFVAQGIAGAHGLALLYNGASFAIAAGVLAPLVPRHARPTRTQWKWMIIAGVVLFFASALQQIGIYYTTVANAGFLTSLYVIITPFLLWLLFRERPGRSHLIAVILAVIGAFFLSTGGRLQLQPGDVLEVAGAGFWALHFVVIGKFGVRFESISFAAGHFLVNGVLSFIVGLVLEDPGILIVPAVVGAVLYRAFFSIGIGYTLQVWAQQHTPPTDAALILGLEAVFAAFAGWLLLRESLGWVQILGCVVILLAVLISQAQSWTSGRIGHEHLTK